MSILWCGGEDIDFPYNFTGFTVDTLAARRRSTYSRCAIRGVANSSAVARSLAFAAVTSLWFSFRVYAGGATRMVGVCKSGAPDGSGLFVGCSAAGSEKLSLYRYDGTTATLLASEAGATLLSSQAHKIDVHIQDYGASATVRVYLNGVEIISWAGDSRVGSVTNLDSVALHSQPGTSGASYYASEIIVADEDTRTLSLVTLAPSGAGDALTFTGAYTTVDEVTLDTGDVSFASAAGQDAQFHMTDLPAGTFYVKHLRVAAYATQDGSPTNLRLGFKSGSVQLDPAQAVGATWAPLVADFPYNPLTSANFTLAEVNGIQLALRSA